MFQQEGSALGLNNKKNRKQGQALLLMIMLLATVITIVLTIAFKASTQTQVTKLEQESQKGLAAAEAGIEQALSTRQVGGSIPIQNIPDFTGTATISTGNNADPLYPNQFISPLLQRDQQFTFYLAAYDPTSSSADPFGPGLDYPSGLTVYYSSENGSCNNIALEITILGGPASNITATRYIADISNPQLLGRRPTNEGNIGSTCFGPSCVLENSTTFACRTSAIPIRSADNARVMIIRTLFGNTRIGFALLSGALQNQGKIITSDVQSTAGSGIRKRVVLFQSFPQIPADFFVTQL